MVSLGPDSQPNNLTHMFDFLEKSQIAHKTLDPESLMGIINNTDDFSFFKNIVENAMMCNILNSPESNFTLFVPHNGAFSDKDLKYMDISLARHIVRTSTLNKRITSELLEDSGASYFATKDPPNRLFVRNFNGETFINDQAKIVYKDIIASNGIIHIVDKLIIPEYIG